MVGHGLDFNRAKPRGIGNGQQASPEAVLDFNYGPQILNQTTWNYPATNKLLFQVGASLLRAQVQFLSRGPVVALAVEGPQDTWEVVRGMMGATNPRKAAPGTIRGDLGILFTENLVHGSDSLASAEREISIFFPNL
mgnify:CR=1 FL=1